MPMPSLAELPDDLEELLRLARGQGRRRLVHDDDARPSARALAISTICISATVSLDTRRLGGVGEAHPPQQLRGRGSHRAPPQRTEEAAGAVFVAEEDVAGHVEVRRQHQLLMDEGDPALLGVAHRLEAERRPSTRIWPSSGAWRRPGS